MDSDDPRIPLLGHPRKNRLRRAAVKLCSLQSWRRRLPISIWLPNYTLECLFRDAIAGITVGLTSIPQGIAYAMVAGLPPQVGLYSSIFPGFVYVLFGSCKDVTVGPTAILAALLAKYVARSQDFAYLAAFLSGCVILLLGVLQLGFLLDFISKPVISGFTTAAALQIAASQLKSLFRIGGSSGDTFIHALINFFKNIKTVQLWDSVLGVISIIFLLLSKRLKVGGALGSVCRYAVRGSNALLVFLASALAFALHKRGSTPFALTGKIEGGLPDFGPPPFSTIVNNQTLSFTDMLEVFGPEGFVMPLVAILESIAIAKAFAGRMPVDATQEMVALGACNLVGSCARAMPATGSFTRTALNHACGVLTPAGSLFKACLVLLAVTLLAEAFFFIPRATLAAIIIVAMTSIIDLSIVRTLWLNSKSELAVWALTLCVGVGAGLEYGIAVGAGADLLRALAHAARPALPRDHCKVGGRVCVRVRMCARLHWCAGARAGSALRDAAPPGRDVTLLLDADALEHIDVGVAEDLITVILDLEKEGHKIILCNFDDKHQQLFEHLNPDMREKFYSGIGTDQQVLGVETERGDILF